MFYRSIVSFCLFCRCWTQRSWATCFRFHNLFPVP